MTPPMKTLVIGGVGFIGLPLVQRLAAVDRTVTILSRRAMNGVSLPKNVHYVRGDFGNIDLIDSLVAAHDEVIHLAYASTPNTSFADPLSDLLLNLRPAVALFEIAARHGVRVVFVSSGGTVYGQAECLPINEAHPTKPIASYGATKLTIENYAHLYRASHGLDVVCVRPANAYGVGQQPFSGQGFIATAMASAMRGKSVKIFGACGTVRDYLYVTDVADGIAAALERGTPGATYNIGSSIGLNNLEVLQAIKTLLHEFGIAMTVENLPDRSSDVAANVLSSAKLNLVSGWAPTVSLEDGLRRTFNWLVEQKYA
jgi:UDP-glucose 4-epimerase